MVKSKAVKRPVAGVARAWRDAASTAKPRPHSTVAKRCGGIDCDE